MDHIILWGLSWLWSYGKLIYNYLCNRCLSPLMLWVWILLMQGVLDTALCYKVCQWLVAGRWFSRGTLASSTNKNDCHDIAEILLKVALNTITLTLTPIILWRKFSISNIYVIALVQNYICCLPLIDRIWGEQAN